MATATLRKMNMNYSSHLFLKLKRIFKFLFILFIAALILLNALLANIYSNILVNLRGDHDQLSPPPPTVLLPSSSASVENIRFRSPLAAKAWSAPIPVGSSSSSPSGAGVIAGDNKNSSSSSSSTSFPSTADYSTLLNITDFRFLLAHVDKCSKHSNSSSSNTTSPSSQQHQPLFMIIFVHSAPGNLAKREAIRRTWANPNNLMQGHNEIRVVFMLGQSSNSSQWEALEAEDRRTGDLVVGNFVDSYRNLTYKHVMGLKWVAYHCARARYVFKADDDIFVDLRQLTYYLKGGFGDDPRRLIACYLNRNSWASRSYRNKWRVSYAEYPEKYYPRYCSGWGIIMSADVVRHLYAITRSRPYFWIDDVFISGLLAADLGLRHVDLASRGVASDYPHVHRWLANSRPHSLPPIFGYPDSDAGTIDAMWIKATQYYAWADGQQQHHRQHQRQLSYNVSGSAPTN